MTVRPEQIAFPDASREPAAEKSSAGSASLALFSALYSKHCDEIYAYISHFAANHFEAEDLTADTFERALKYFGSFNPEKAQMRTWLFAVATNVVKDHHRHRGRRQGERLDDIPSLASADASAEEIAAEMEERKRLRKAIATLPESHIRIVGLKFGAGLNNREIAGITGLSESNVGSIVNRCLKKIAKVLS